MNFFFVIFVEVDPDLLREIDPENVRNRSLST